MAACILSMLPIIAIFFVAMFGFAGIANAVYHPADYALLCYGGGGPLHVAGYTSGVAYRDVLVPAWAAGFSAYGCACADFEYRYDQTIDMPIMPGADGMERAGVDGGPDLLAEFRLFGVEWRRPGRPGPRHGGQRAPHPRPLPTRGRGARMPRACPLPPCGGGLGWGVRRSPVRVVTPG